MLIRLATKYAAELLVKHPLVKLEQLAKDSDNTIDDDIVAVLKKEQTMVVGALNGRIVCMTAPVRELQSRRPARTASSTAKLDLLIAHNERLEGSINRLADSVHQLAMSSVRFEEKSSTQEARITELEKDTSVI